MRAAQAELPYGTAAFRQLVEKHTARVFRRSYKILGVEADAQDAVQDVFLNVYRNLAKFRRERPFEHWLSRITLNACRQILRRRAREQRRQHALAEATLTDEAGGESPDPPLRRVLHEMLDTLDPTTRIALTLRFVEGYSYREAAEVLNMGESALKMRITRAAQRLREEYRERQERAAAGAQGADHRSTDDD